MTKLPFLLEPLMLVANTQRLKFKAGGFNVLN